MKSSLFVKTLLTLFYYFQCIIGISPSDDQSELSTSIKDRLIASNGENANEYVQYKTPQFLHQDVYLYESFDDVHRFKKIWHKSESTKGPKGEFKYDGTWDIVVTHQKIRGDYGLRMRSKSKHHAISRKLDQEFNFTGSPLVIQYDVQFRNGQECGGAYIKLLSAPSGNLSLINDQSRYSIMFGPDKCGSDHRLHFIFSHINSVTGKIREIHWKDAHTLTNLADVFIDGKWHLFRLSISPSNRFEIAMDKRIVAIGSLLTDFSPSVNPELEIDDPEDTKPEDWDEREKIPDPDAVKPDDWDNDEPKLIPDPKARKPKGWLENEPAMIPDPNAIKPEDWSEEENGSWKPPMIKNPRCSSAPGCGPWSPPMIDNPKYKGEWMPPLIPNLAYQGKWVPRKIPNPDYFEDKHPYKSIAPIDAVTFELWTLSDGVVFDNILITSDIAIADSIAMATYQIKKEINDLETDNWFKRMIKQTNKKPWLWAVYIVVTAIPVIFFIGFCCVTPGSSSESSASSTNYSSETLSSIFELPNPSTSATSATHLHPHHLLTESCKNDHTDQYAFRYHDACINDSGCSADNLETTGLRSRFTSRNQDINNSGYCSSYNVQHSHSSSTQHSSNILSSSFNFNSCLEEMIPDEEEEEDEDYLKEAEMRQFEENGFNLMDGELIYDENIDQIESGEDKLNGDRETCNSDAPDEMCNLHEPPIDNLMNGTEKENVLEDVDYNSKLTGDIQLNDAMLNLSDNDNTYDNNDSAPAENEINEDPAQDSIANIITDDFTSDNIDVNIDEDGETNVNESTDNFQSQNAIMIENSSVRRRRKGKGRRKDTPGSRKNGDEGISEAKGSTRQGNNKSKNRRTKARRD